MGDRRAFPLFFLGRGFVLCIAPVGLPRMDNLQVGEGLFAFFRQRLIGKPGIRKLCIAPFGRKFDGMQQRLGTVALPF